jgi:hypothetical protein
MVTVIRTLLRIITLVGIPTGIVAGSIWAFKRNRFYLFATISNPKTAKAIMLFEVTIGVALGLAFTLIKIPLNERTCLYGFPIPLVVLQKSGDTWIPFESSLYLLVFVLNPMFYMMLIQLYGAIRSYWKKAIKA